MTEEQKVRKIEYHKRMIHNYALRLAIMGEKYSKVNEIRLNSHKKSLEKLLKNT